MGKSLAPKPDGQLDPMPQIRRVEGKTDSHKLSSDFGSAVARTQYEWNHAQTYTKIIHVTIKHQLSRHLYGVGENISQIVSDHSISTQNTAKSCRSTTVTNPYPFQQEKDSNGHSLRKSTWSMIWNGRTQ